MIASPPVGRKSSLLCIALYAVAESREQAALTLRRQLFDGSVHVAEDHLRTADGRPKYDLTYYAVNKRGEFGAATMYGTEQGGKFAVCDAQGTRQVDLAYLHEGQAPQ